jgi:hypothetical protein
MGRSNRGRLAVEVAITVAVVLAIVLALGLNSVAAIPLPDSQNHMLTGMTLQLTADNLQSPSLGGCYPQSINTYGMFSEEPAPMGIADYGIGPNGPYEYATNSFIGITNIGSLSTSNSTGGGEMTIQLNAVLVFNYGGNQYVYWIQNVAGMDTSDGSLSFNTNIWNYSALSANMSSSGVYGNGVVSHQGSGRYYYSSLASLSLPGSDILLTYPATITLNVTTAVNSYGEPMVLFSYDDGYGSVTYDTITFVTHGQTSLTGFEVNGFNSTTSRNFYDAELILGGNGNGTSTVDTQSDIQLQLEYWNGHNYQIVENAYNYGSDTAETILNVLDNPYYHPDNGGLYADLQAGAGGQLGGLYNESQIGIVNITSPLNSGILSITSTDNPNAVAAQIPFVNGEVIVPIFPGNYTFQLIQNGQIYDQGNFGVSAGFEQDLNTPFNGPQPGPTPTVSISPSPYPSGATSFLNSINAFLRPITQPINNMIGGALGGFIPDSTMNFLFVEQPIYLLGILIVFVVAISAVVTVAMHRRRGSTGGQISHRASRRPLIQMILTPIFYAFLTWIILTILNLDQLVNSELSNAVGSGGYGLMETILILVMAAACCISIYRPYRTYHRQKLAEKSEMESDNAVRGGVVAAVSPQPPLPPAVTPVTAPEATTTTTPPMAQAQTPKVAPDLLQKLQALKGMLDSGLINQQDYDEQKKRILEKV